MKKLIITAVALFSFTMLSATPAFADTKIGVIDIQSMMQKLPQMKAIGESLKKQFGDRDKALNDAQAALKKAADDYARNNAVMAANDKQAAEKKLMEMQQDVQQKQASLQKDFMAEQNKQINALLDKIKDVVQKVAAKDKLDIVLINASVAYSDKKLDVTNEVLEQLK